VLKDVAGTVSIILALPVVCIGVVREARVLDFLGGLGSDLVGEGKLDLIWLIHSI